MNHATTHESRHNSQQFLRSQTSMADNEIVEYDEPMVNTLDTLLTLRTYPTHPQKEGNKSGLSNDLNALGIQVKHNTTQTNTDTFSLRPPTRLSEKKMSKEKLQHQRRQQKRQTQKPFSLTTTRVGTARRQQMVSSLVSVSRRRPHAMNC